MPIKLFNEIPRGTIFTFGDRPERELIKFDSSHYIGPERPHFPTVINSHVAVFPKQSVASKSIYDLTTGDSNG